MNDTMNSKMRASDIEKVFLQINIKKIRKRKSFHDSEKNKKTSKSVQNSSFHENLGGKLFLRLFSF